MAYKSVFGPIKSDGSPWPRPQIPAADQIRLKPVATPTSQARRSDAIQALPANLREESEAQVRHVSTVRVRGFTRTGYGYGPLRRTGTRTRTNSWREEKPEGMTDKSYGCTNKGNGKSNRTRT